MFDASLIKDLTELLGKSLTFKDIEAIGSYLFKDHGFSTHALANIDRKLSISPLNAARTLVAECDRRGRLKDLFAFVIELDGVPLNGRSVRLAGLENLLYSLVRSGVYYDFGKRRFVDLEAKRKRLAGWGVLRQGREYQIAIVSVDICRSSSLLKKHSPAVMERVYYRMWDFFKHRLDAYEGRMWSWAGDGGVLAFHGDDREVAAVSCCLEIFACLPVFNLQPDKPIHDDIALRMGIDSGPVRFVENTGRIISEVINYAVHLEKNATRPGALAVSDRVYDRLPPSMRSVFTRRHEFEGRVAHATA